MTPSGFIKTKTAFSIESLVGRGSSPTPSDSPERTESPTYMKSAVLEPLFSKAFLNLQENPSIIRRPQPVNGAIHNSQTNLELQFPSTFQGTKEFGAIPNLLLNSPFAFASLPQLHGLPLTFQSQLNPLLGGLPGLGTPIPRDFSPYPWMPSRHGRMFQHGIPSHEQLAYFLQPFRKSKRIRTAFSPSQLLKLEQSFEKNQYVVGVERKHLAQNLNLSETQVKVWFQNRRTKEKKVQPDDDDVMDQGRSKINEKISEEDYDEGAEEDEVTEETLGSYKEKIINENHLAEISKISSEVTKINNLASDNKLSDSMTSASVHSDSYSLIPPAQCNSHNLDTCSTLDS